MGTADELLLQSWRLAFASGLSSLSLSSDAPAKTADLGFAEMGPLSLQSVCRCGKQAKDWAWGLLANGLLLIRPYLAGADIVPRSRRRSSDHVTKSLHDRSINTFFDVFFSFPTKPLL